MSTAFTNSLVDAAIAQSRTRASWNDRLIHWERPASETEEVKIQRAANQAAIIIANNEILISERAKIFPQGSYYNNTNVRLEADMDIRVQLPDILVKYADDVDRNHAYSQLGYVKTGRQFADIRDRVRNAIITDCQARLGHSEVNPGSKAIRIDGLSGSRAEVDLVPAFRLHWISNNPYGGYKVTEGAAIFGLDGSETLNFPAQHHNNGKSKRGRTRHRFKKNVRMLKRLNYELVDVGSIARRLPSFLVECLAYSVDDEHYLIDDDDRYGRLIRLLYQMKCNLENESWIASATEVNEMKILFHPTQNWTLSDAKEFVREASNRLLT